MKRLLLIFFLLALALTGCGFFDETYVVETDYTLPDRQESSKEGTVAVTNLGDLTDAIRNTVAEGATEKTILFGLSYPGNPTEDLAAACWQVRTEDALCAYCVENIAYETRQIVSNTEAKLNVSYSSGALPVDEIISMPYATELNEIIAEAISSGRSRMAILINRSVLASENMVSRFSEVYRRNPGLAPEEPEVSVSLFSGAGTQRLYEISLHGDLTEQEFQRRKMELDAIAFPPEEAQDELSTALSAFERLEDCCDRDGPETVYAALIEHGASPEGIALGYVELCRKGGLECIIVNGQKDWEDHFWNIVRVDGQYYHVDVFAGMDDGFLKSDEDFWGSYRWTVNEYPKCETEFPPEEAPDEKISEEKPEIEETAEEIRVEED